MSDSDWAASPPPTVQKDKDSSPLEEYQAMGDMKKLGKRLAYLLRYGAEKEGLKVSDSGFVELMELLRVPVLRWYKPHDILKETELVTEAGYKRFERKQENGSTYIRALYGRRMQRNPHHEGTNVPRLLESCMVKICDNINDYDLQNFPDGYLVNAIIHKLKCAHRLTNKAFACLLGPGVEHLDLGGTIVTVKTLTLVGQRCQNLKTLNLRESSYVLNDHLMENLLKKLPDLETLNLAGCTHLTDRTLHAIIKHCRNIATLNLSNIPELSQDIILHLVTTCPKLYHLDIYDNMNITPEGIEVLREFCYQQNTVVVLNGLDLDGDTDQNTGKCLNLASGGKYW